MEIGYVVRDARKWTEDREGCFRVGFGAEYYGRLLEKAWEEAAFVFGCSCDLEKWEGRSRIKST
jgi:hypothetical protein